MQVKLDNYFKGNNGLKTDDWSFEKFKRLAVGAFGVVYKAKGRYKGQKTNNRDNPKPVIGDYGWLALKFINMTKMEQVRTSEEVYYMIFREIYALQATKGEPGVVDIIDHFMFYIKGDKYMVLVTEIIYGVELFEHVRNNNNDGSVFSIDMFKRLLVDIVETIHHLYTKYSICHNDLKPENIMILNSFLHEQKKMVKKNDKTAKGDKLVKDDKKAKGDKKAKDDKRKSCLMDGGDKSKSSCIKIVDFGLVRFVENPPKLQTIIDNLRSKYTDSVLNALEGTPGFLSPEEMADTELVDYQPSNMWTLGMTLYEILSNRYPFPEILDSNLYTSKYVFANNQISDDCSPLTFENLIDNNKMTDPAKMLLKQIVYGMLQIDVKKRMKIDEIKRLVCEFAQMDCMLD